MKTINVVNQLVSVDTVSMSITYKPDGINSDVSRVVTVTPALLQFAIRILTGHKFNMNKLPSLRTVQSRLNRALSSIGLMVTIIGSARFKTQQFVFVAKSQPVTHPFTSDIVSKAIKSKPRPRIWCPEHSSGMMPTANRVASVTPSKSHGRNCGLNRYNMAMMCIVRNKHGLVKFGCCCHVASSSKPFMDMSNHRWRTNHSWNGFGNWNGQKTAVINDVYDTKTTTGMYLVAKTTFVQWWCVSVHL